MGTGAQKEVGHAGHGTARWWVIFGRIGWHRRTLRDLRVLEDAGLRFSQRRLSA